MTRLMFSLAFLVFAFTALGQEQEFIDQNFAITPAGDWENITQQVPVPDAVLALTKPDRTAVIVISVGKQGRLAEPMNEQTAAEFEKGLMETGGLEKISSEFTDIGGITAYRRIGQGIIKGKNVSSLILAIPTKEKFYSLNAMRFDGNANEDPDVLKTVSSFRFLHSPEAASTISGKLTPRQQGFIEGYITAFLAVVGFCIWGIVKVFRKKKGPPKPPPLPPAIPS